MKQGDTTTLYQRLGITGEHVVSVGEFRRVSWCETHDTPTCGCGLEPYHCMEHPDDECEATLLWMEQA